jgi:TP901 family phage tail tape measure protein
MAEFKGLTINLGLDASGVQRGLSDITKNIRSSTGLLNQANRALKLDPKNLDAVRTKFNALNQILPLNRERLRNLQTELKQLEKLDGGTGKFRDKINRVNSEILKTTTQIKGYEKELSKLNKDYKIKVSAETREAEVSLRKTNDLSKNLGTTSGNLGGKFNGLSMSSKVLGGALAGFAAAGAAKLSKELIEVGKSAIVFQKEFGAVRTLLPQSSEVVDKFESSLRGVSRQTGVASNELAKGLYQALSAGVAITNDAAVATKFLGTATKLSVGGFTSAETAVDTLTTILNAYKLETDEATKVSDQLIATQNLGKTTVQQLGSTLGQVIPVAADAGVAFDQVGASIATLTAQGIKTDVATTALRNILVELNDSSSKLGKSFENVAKKSFKDFIAEGGTVQGALKLVSDEAKRTKTPIGSIVGKETIAAFNTLATSAEEFDKNLVGVRDSVGLTEKNFETATDNLSDQWKRFTNNLKADAEEKAKPAIEGLTESLKKANDITEAGAWGRIGNALGGAFLKKFTPKTQEEKDRLKAQAIENEESQKLFKENLDAEESMLSGSFENRAELRQQELDNNKNWLSEIGSAFVSGWTETYQKWGEGWNTFSSYYGEQWNTLKTNMIAWGEGVKSWWSEKWNSISSGWNEWYNNFKNSFSEKWNSLVQFFKDKVGSIKTWWTDKWNELTEAWKSWSNNWSSTVSAWWSGVKSWWSEKIEGIKSLFSVDNWVQTGKDMINGIISGIKSAGGSLFNSLKDMANSALDSVKSTLGIKSPSRVFGDVVGKQIPAGIAVGVEANTKDAINSVSSMSNDLVNAASFDYSINKAKNSGVFNASGNIPVANTTNTKSINVSFGNITINGGNTNQGTVKNLLEIIERELGNNLGALL